MVRPASPAGSTRILPIRIFVEGAAARGNNALVAEAKRAFSELIHRATGARVHIAPAGSRQAAYRAFSAATGCHALLLVDAEASVAEVEQPWAHLKTCDGWERPADATDAQAHLMTQVMETWLLADPAAFAGVAPLDDSKITKWPALEQVHKREIHALLERLTGLSLEGGRGTFKSKAFAVLVKVDPTKLAARCPSADRLFKTIRTLVS